LKINISIAGSIADCAESWDALLPEDHHLASRHLLAFEAAAIDNIENRYLRVFHKEQLIGVIYLQLFLFKHEHLNFSKPATFLSASLQLLLPKKLHLLVCGNLFRVDFQGFYFQDPVRPTLAFEAIQLFLQENPNYQPCGIILKDCETMLVEEIYRPFGYTFFSGDVTMELARRHHWLSFDDYLKDLNKNYLQRAKKIIRAFEPITTAALGAEEILQSASAIEQLYWNVVNKQTIKLGTVNAAYFSQLKKDLAENFEFHALYLSEKMVGFYTFIFYKDHMETHYIGLDYEVNHSAKLYFNILFRSTEKMIQGRYNSLELGRTAREAKVNLGALPKQIFNYIHVKNPLVKITLQYVVKRFSEAATLNIVERNPLK
jgi:hypothetical protein